MRPAFLVSDEDLKSIRTQPWFIEMNGEAVFMHDSVLKLLMQQQNPAVITPTNGAYDEKGRSLTCDQPACPRNLADRAFATYAARQMHRAQTHGIPGQFAEKHKQFPRRPTTPALPPPSGEMEKLISRHKPKSYDYKEQDAQGICGIGDCKYKSKVIRSLHFHRSVTHKIRGINWARHYHKRNPKNRPVGRPRKVA